MYLLRRKKFSRITCCSVTTDQFFKGHKQFNSFDFVIFLTFFFISLKNNYFTINQFFKNYAPDTCNLISTYVLGLFRKIFQSGILEKAVNLDVDNYFINFNFLSVFNIFHMV